MLVRTSRPSSGLDYQRCVFTLAVKVAREALKMMTCRQPDHPHSSFLPCVSLFSLLFFTALLLFLHVTDIQTSHHPHLPRYRTVGMRDRQPETEAAHRDAGTRGREGGRGKKTIHILCFIPFLLHPSFFFLGGDSLGTKIILWVNPKQG